MAEQNKIFKDCVCRKIVIYLKERLNYLGKRDFNLSLVNGIRDYDCLSVGLNEFPLLKVFRTSDFFLNEKNKVISRMTISYCLAYPNLETLAPLTSNVSKYIHFIMNDFESKLGVYVNQEDRQASYRITSGGDQQNVLSILDYYFSITEGI